MINELISFIFRFFFDYAVVVRCECNIQTCVCNVRGTMTPSVLRTWAFYHHGQDE